MSQQRRSSTSSFQAAGLGNTLGHGYFGYQAKENSTLKDQRNYLKAMLEACLTEHQNRCPKKAENFSTNLKALPTMSENDIARVIGKTMASFMELSSHQQDEVLANLYVTVPRVASVIATKIGKQIAYPTFSPTAPN